MTGEEIVLQRRIVVLSSQRASGHLRSFKPRTFLVMLEYLWESNSQDLAGLIVNTFLIDRFFIFLTFFEIFENRAPHGSINSLQNGLAVLSNRLRVYRLGLKIIRLCFLEQRLI